MKAGHGSDAEEDGARANTPSPPLPRLGRGRLSSLASDTLLSRIVRGVWKPGDRLPSERQLSEQLGMSRASVREAIRGLEAMGLIDVRHGQGVFVREAGVAAEDAFFAGWQIDHTYAISELLAFRMLIEPELAALAAEHADDRFVEELAGIMSSMEAAAAAGNLDLLVQSDTAFHEAISRRAGNRLYRDLLEHIAGLSIDSRRISLSVPGRAVQVIAMHAGIVKAIHARDPEGASCAMRAHLDRFADDMRVRPVATFLGGTRVNHVSLYAPPAPLTRRTTSRSTNSSASSSCAAAKRSRSMTSGAPTTTSGAPAAGSRSRSSRPSPPTA